MKGKSERTERRGWFRTVGTLLFPTTRCWTQRVPFPLWGGRIEKAQRSTSVCRPPSSAFRLFLADGVVSGDDVPAVAAVGAAVGEDYLSGVGGLVGGKKEIRWATPPQSTQVIVASKAGDGSGKVSRSQWSGRPI